MTPDELREWLKEEQSQSSGWTGESGELIGHGSGRKIDEILEHNPSHKPSGYDDSEMDHMRKVVAYCKRHLAREENAKQNPSSKSYRALKNWGHDALKTE